MEEYVVAAVADATERNLLERIRLRKIRDASNPFDLTETKFRKLFRLPKDAALHLLNILVSPELGEGEIPRHIKVLAALNFYSQGSYQAHVGEGSLLGLSQPSVSRCVNMTTNAIVNELAYQYIKFPHTQQEKNMAKAAFQELYGMPNVLGSIDGTHVAIFKPCISHPTAPGSLFYNRKGFYSINCQIVADAYGKIISVNASFPGSTHDAAIWSSSHLYQTLEQSYINGERNQWLLGDKGYPLQPWLMIPILRPASEAEERYNNIHGNARNVVEMCYGRLKNKLRCLHKHRTLHYEPPTASKIITSCCVLFNLFYDVLSDDEDEDSDEDEDNDDNDDSGEDDAENEELPSDFLTNARNIRENLIRLHFS